MHLEVLILVFKLSVFVFFFFFGIHAFSKSVSLIRKMSVGMLLWNIKMPLKEGEGKNHFKDLQFFIKRI